MSILATVGVWESGAQQRLKRLAMWWQEVIGEQESGELGREVKQGNSSTQGFED